MYKYTEALQVISRSLGPLDALRVSSGWLMKGPVIKVLWLHTFWAQARTLKQNCGHSDYSLQPLGCLKGHDFDPDGLVSGQNRNGPLHAVLKPKVIVSKGFGGDCIFGHSLDLAGARKQPQGSIES